MDIACTPGYLPGGGLREAPGLSRCNGPIGTNNNGSMLVHAPYAYTHIDPLDPPTRRSGLLRPLVDQLPGTISD